jgi:hypothetical protein
VTFKRNNPGCLCCGPPEPPPCTPCADPPEEIDVTITGSSDPDWNATWRVVRQADVEHDGPSLGNWINACSHVYSIEGPVGYPLDRLFLDLMKLSDGDPDAWQITLYAADAVLSPPPATSYPALYGRDITWDGDCDLAALVLSLNMGFGSQASLTAVP